MKLKYQLLILLFIQATFFILYFCDVTVFNLLSFALLPTWASLLYAFGSLIMSCVRWLFAKDDSKHQTEPLNPVWWIEWLKLIGFLIVGTGIITIILILTK